MSASAVEHRDLVVVGELRRGPWAMAAGVGGIELGAVGLRILGVAAVDKAATQRLFLADPSWPPPSAGAAAFCAAAKCGSPPPPRPSAWLMLGPEHQRLAPRKHMAQPGSSFCALRNAPVAPPRD